MENEFNFNNLVPHLLHVADRYCGLKWHVPFGKHDYHNLMMIISGEGYCGDNETEQQALPGMVFYHGPGESFGFKTSRTNLMHCFGVNFQVASVNYEDTEWVTQNVARLPLERRINLMSSEKLNRYFTEISDEWERERDKKQFSYRYKTLFLNILRDIYENSSSFAESKASEIIRPTLMYIDKSYDRDITLKELAEISGLNPSYFGSIFKKFTGQTPFEYINTVRVDKSIDFILAGYSINEAALKTGFCDCFYFSKVFKKLKGCCPSEYVKKHQIF